MDISILLTLLCYLPLLTKATSSSCSSSPLSPEIRFPFRIDALQPHECGLPHFNLICKQNTTMIHLPNYKILQVKSISYDGQTRLDLVDPSNCVHEVFLNLNLSLTPFTYYYHVHRYTYINCTTQLDADSLQQVPCLSASNYHVYVVPPSFSTPVSCRLITSVEIPFGYSPYISDASFGLSLTWSSTRIDEEKEEKEEEEAALVGIICAETWHLIREHLRGNNDFLPSHFNC